MAAPRRTLHVSLEAKVMLAVLLVLIALPAITLLMVNERISQQMRSDADLALRTARTSFVQALRYRADELALRFRAGSSDARLQTILGLNDAPTMRVYLNEVLEDFHADDTEVA